MCWNKLLPCGNLYNIERAVRLLTVSKSLYIKVYVHYNVNIGKFVTYARIAIALKIQLSV